MAFDTLAVRFAATETNISSRQVESVLELLLTEKCTVPFVSRYRKEKTGNLDEVQIRQIQESYENYLEREKRREYVLDAILKMGQLTPELEKQIKAAETINQLEDLYAPYKAKKKTKGMKAREAGLLPLAEAILQGTKDLEALLKELAPTFAKAESEYKTPEQCMEGAFDIIMEMMAHDTEIKEILRKDYWQSANLTSLKKEDAETQEEYLKFKDYFEYSEPVKELREAKAAHRFMAMKRGLTLKVLKVDVVYSEDAALGVLKKKYIPAGALTEKKVMELAKKAYKNAIHPSLDLEIKSELKQLSDEAAISIFGTNLKNLLLQPYLGPKTVLGVDPGVRTGCKLVVVDSTGKFVVDTVVYPHPPREAIHESATIMEAMIQQFKVSHIAIGNGTYGRETLDFIEDNVPSVKNGTCHATIISEAGASIYSASDIAREEFPDKDPTVRGSISIARRFQDPLAELVKIDPKSIGVGQYQHDVNQVKLKKSLDGVVESCVNFVGVDLNTASAPLLSYISGIGPGLATNIVKHREQIGGFKSRKDLLNVTRFTEKVFEQCAGFMRIYNGENPLDATFIHPEKYANIENWAKGHGLELKDLIKNNTQIDALKKDKAFIDAVGEYSAKDIIQALGAPTQDPRTAFKSVEFRKDVREMKDLTIGQWYTGVVNNITQFGAFVDIGIKESGLLHISQMADRFVENPLEVFKVGQEVKVRVIEVDMQRKRISLSCKSDSAVTSSGPRERSQVGSGAPRGGNTGMPKKMPPPQDIKNNAFAALKNLKIGK